MVSLAEAQESARLTGLAMIAALRTELGDLDRVEAWLTISGYVNAAEGYPQTTAVINPVSELVLEIFGDAGRHARTAIGVSALPLNLPVIVAAELTLKS
ncbi:RidA family protein [Microlunatus parietis]|uniref:RidA family protein n=1 Tax=Microlunatus parietis TaxID=682979 RepID=UPI001C54B5B5